MGVQDAQARVGGGAAAAGGSTHGGGGQTFSYPVEVADGRRLTISWSQGENPMAVAQRFATENMIGGDELQDIANFVAQASGMPPPAAAPAPAAISQEQV